MDITIPHTNTSLITHGSEMRNQERMKFLSFVLIGKKKERKKLPPEPKRVSAGLPRRVLEATMKENCAYLAWLERRFGSYRALRIADEYYIGGIGNAYPP